MDDIDAAFKSFCQQNNITDPTDRDRVFFVAGIQSTMNQRPVAYGHFAPDGSLMQMLDFIEPNRISKPTPLYARPIAGSPKPNLHDSVLLHVWKTCYAPDDQIGFAKWVERYTKSMN